MCGEGYGIGTKKMENLRKYGYNFNMKLKINKFNWALLHLIPLFCVWSGMWVINDVFGCIALAERLRYQISFCGVTNGFWTVNYSTLTDGACPSKGRLGG